MPSAKYAFALSSLKFLNGNTAIDFSGDGSTTYLLAALAAATILSKRGSQRKASQQGLKRRSPYFCIGTPEYSSGCEDPGIVATISSCSSARSLSPPHE